MKKFAEAFKNKYEQFRGNEKEVAIFTHHAPDPDAIGSAIGMQWLLKRKFMCKSKVFYGGEVSHPQNKTMINTLDIRMQQASEFNKNDFDSIIIVDATSNNVDVPYVDFVLDHHRVEETAENCVDYIESVGSCATLVWELIGELGIDLSEMTDLDSYILTAIYFGVRNDTEDFIFATERDFKVVQTLNRFIDKKKLQKIISYPYPEYFFELERRFNEDGNSKLKKSVYAGTIGVVTPLQRDALPALADRILRLAGVETSIVFGAVDDKLEASVRSQNTNLEVNTFCQDVFGKEYSGGKQGSGGARVPLGICGVHDAPDEIRIHLWNALRDKIFHKIFSTIEGKS